MPAGYQQDVALVGSGWFMLHAFGHPVHFHATQRDLAVAKVDIHPACEHDEYLVGLGVAVPDELALDFDQLDRSWGFDRHQNGGAGDNVDKGTPCRQRTHYRAAARKRQAQFWA
jgi:hypothetical protein